MNNIIALFKGGLSRSKGILIVALAASIGVAFLIIVGTSSMITDIGSIRLGFIDRDASAVSSDFARHLEDDLGMELVISDSVDDMNTELVNKRISGIIEVPPGFEEALLSEAVIPVELTFAGDYANEVFTRGYVESYMQSLGLLSLAAGGDKAELGLFLEDARSNRVSVETLAKDEELFQDQKDRDIYRLMIAFILMLGFYMSISIAGLLFTDRTNGTYRRIKAGSVTSFQYVSSVAAIGVILMLLINGPSLGLYAVAGGDPGVPFAATAGLMAAYSLFVIAFGIFVGLVMPSFSGIIALTVAVATITSMLGGAFFPVEMAPAAFHAMGHIAPQFWFFEAVNAIQTGVGNPLGPALIILLMAVLFFVLSGIYFAGNRGMLRTVSTRGA